MTDAVVILLVAAAVFFGIRSIIRGKKQGKSSCGFGCAGCSGCSGKDEKGSAGK